MSDIMDTVPSEARGGHWLVVSLFPRKPGTPALYTTGSGPFELAEYIDTVSGDRGRAWKLVGSQTFMVSCGDRLDCWWVPIPDIDLSRPGGAS